jgi:parvulin-like peptidyl-prolyl isomerase
VDDQALAQSLLEQLRSGVDFATLAQQYSLDRVTGENGGDLSFFARGSLLVPEIEEAAFNLQPGEFSEVVAGNRADGSGTTFYVIQLIERDPQRDLSADMLFKQLQLKFEQWLAQQWDQAKVFRFIEV